MPEPAPVERRPARHVAEYSRGYMSMRCLHGMDGCDDLACICRCHEESAEPGGRP